MVWQDEPESRSSLHVTAACYVLSFLTQYVFQPSTQQRYRITSSNARPGKEVSGNLAPAQFQGAVLEAVITTVSSCNTPGVKEGEFLRGRVIPRNDIVVITNDITGDIPILL